MKHLAHLLLICSIAPAPLACVSTISMRESLTPSPPSLMIASKSPRTAYLVLDPAKVPNQIAVAVDGQQSGATLTDVETFVTRDLKGVFANYFDRVEIVRASQFTPAPDSVQIDVKIERVEIRVIQPGTGYATIKWGLGLRPLETSDYLYAFASESAGTPGSDIDIVLRSAFEAALTEFLQGYTKKGIHQKLLAADAASVDTTPSATAVEL